MTRILHIAPQLPPVIDGVGDFALGLARRLESLTGLPNAVLAATALRLPGELRRRVEEHSCELILLHYSGYGYDPLGVPRFLLREIEDLARTHSVAIFFHELWASGPPWKRVFYSAFTQKRIVERLARLATLTFTSTPKMARMLGGRSCLVPIPGSVPEPDTFVARSSAGPFRAVVFGQEHTRLRTLTEHLDLLPMLSSLHLVGRNATSGSADFRLAAHALSPSRIVTTANACSERIGEILADHDLSLSFYPHHLLTKSASVMSAFAVGCPVVLPRRDADELFDPAPPVLLGSEITPAALARTAKAVFAWYRSHVSWDVLTPRIAESLGLLESLRVAA